LHEVGVGVKNYLFLRKLGKFFSGLSEVSLNDRQAFSQKIGKNEKFQRQVGEALVLLLDKLDDMSKPSLVAHAFNAYIMERIDYEQYRRLAFAIDRCFLEDLQVIRDIRRTDFEPHVAMSLSSCGLLEPESIPSVRGAPTENRFRITEIGKLFVQYVLNKE
jgi:hypothetical protein